MSECMICGNKCTGKTCSGACRAKLSRQAHVQAHGTERTVEAHAPKRTRTEGCKCAIPGDEDYQGACHKVDGVWKVNKDIEPTPVKDMTRVQLEQAIRAYPNDQWINSPEHKELSHRIGSLSVDELEAEGYHVPVRKITA